MSDEMKAVILTIIILSFIGFVEFQLSQTIKQRQEREILKKVKGLRKHEMIIEDCVLSFFERSCSE